MALKRLPSTFRLSFGLVLLTSSILLLADLAGKGSAIQSSLADERLR